MSTVANPSYRQRIGYQAGLLGGFALMAAAMLVMGDIATRDSIALRKAEDLNASLSQVIPNAIHDNDLLADVVEIDAGGPPVKVYRATRNGQVTGAAFQVTATGYAGEIDLILGLDAQGRVLGTRVLAHKETPGLGDKIDVAKDDWIRDFEGKSLDDPPAERWAVKKDGGVFDHFSGATITPRGVVRALKGGLEFYAAHRDGILSLATPQPVEGPTAAAATPGASAKAAGDKAAANTVAAGSASDHLSGAAQ